MASRSDPSTDPLPRWTIFDYLKRPAKHGSLEWMFQQDLEVMLQLIRARGEPSVDLIAREYAPRSMTFRHAIANLRAHGLPVTFTVAQGYTAMFMYLSLAMERGYEIWALTNHAVGELFSTRIPDKIYRERLPSLPAKVVLLTVPSGSLDEAMSSESERRNMEVISFDRDDDRLLNRTRSVLLVEREPNKAWCGVVFMKGDGEGVGSYRSYFFSFDMALPSTWSVLDGPLGHLLLNLFLCVENRETIETQVSPRFVGKAGSKKHDRNKRRKSTEPYTLIDISEPERRYVSDPEDRDAGSMSDRSPKGHWVKTHWHRYWVRKPGERFVEDSRENEHGNTLHLVKRRIARYWAGDDADRGGEQGRVKVTAQPGRGLATDT